MPHKRKMNCFKVGGVDSIHSTPSCESVLESYIVLPRGLKTMKNKGFHIQKPNFLLGKTRFLMVCGPLVGRTYGVPTFSAF